MLKKKTNDNTQLVLLDTSGTSSTSGLCFLGGILAKCNTLSGPVVLLSGIYSIKITNNNTHIHIYTPIEMYNCT